MITGSLIPALGMSIVVNMFGVGEFLDRLLGLGPTDRAVLNTKIELVVGEADTVLASGVIQEEVFLTRPGTVSTYMMLGEALVVELPSSNFAFILPVAGANGGIGRALPVIAEACENRPPFTYDSSVFEKTYQDWFDSLTSTPSCTVQTSFPIIVRAPGADNFEWLTLEQLGLRLGYEGEMLGISVSLTNLLPTNKNEEFIERAFYEVNQYNLMVENPSNERKYPISIRDFTAY